MQHNLPKTNSKGQPEKETTRGHIERQREEERRKPTTLKISKIKDKRMNS